MFLQFPEIQYFRVFRTGDTVVKGGLFQVSEDIDLKHCLVSLYIQGALAGTEQLRMEIYPSDNATTAIYTSEWASLSGVGTYSPNYLGNIYLDFATPKPLNNSIEYAFRFRIQNYTANDPTFFVALNLDWVDRVNETPSELTAGVRMRLIGFK